MRRALVWLSTTAIVGLAALSFSNNHKEHSATEVFMLTDRLLEFGAVDFVHGFYEGPEQVLFDCVAVGIPLNRVQSIRYRTIYQNLLLDKQSLFSWLDANLQLRRDEGMLRSNNIESSGIKGLHDHHDASAADNLSNISRNLLLLKTAWPLRRALLANDIYKDLTDLMVHMAPATHSIGLISQDAIPQGLGASYRPFYEAMKTAQNANVNSAEYWQAIEQAKHVYSALILLVQSEVRAENGQVVHGFSGKWLSLQTIAPRLSEDSPSADARKMGGANAPPCLA